MGAKTFLGIAKHYFSREPGLQVLPGRQIFILGNPKIKIDDDQHGAFRSVYKRGYGSEWVQLVHELLADARKIGIDKSNFRIIVDDDAPQAIIDRIEMNYELNGKTLFVAGGAKVYHKYLPLASRIHETLIVKEIQGDNLVKLHPETIELLEDVRWKILPVESEKSKGLEAIYRTIIK